VAFALKTVIIPAGRRSGRTFDNESEFLGALDAGDRVFTERNGVYFEVIADSSGVRYVAHESKPDDL